MGRHSEYKPQHATEARHSCETYGLKDDGLAEVLNVDVSTISKWKKDFPEFSEAIRAGRALFDNAQVVQAAIRLITGFEYEDQVLGPGGIAVTLKKFCPPNTRVFELWMRNRQGWRINDPVTTIKVSEPDALPEQNDSFQELAKRLMEDRYSTKVLGPN